MIRRPEDIAQRERIAVRRAHRMLVLRTLYDLAQADVAEPVALGALMRAEPLLDLPPEEVARFLRYLDRRGWVHLNGASALLTADGIDTVEATVAPSATSPGTDYFSA